MGWNLVTDPATLLVAWLRIRNNRGSRSAGIDGQTRRYVENRYGVDRFLEDIRSSLRDGSFGPLPVRERGIPKKGGRIRYLGISTLRDRVVQMALKLVMEPILESDFQACSFGRWQETGEVLYNPAAMRIIRYRYRGSKIATPWDEVEAGEPAFRQMCFEETEFLGRLQESLVG